MKKTFTFLIILMITLSQFAMTIHGEANTTKNSADLDISQGWTISEYVSNIQPDVDKIFLQNLDMNTGTLRGVLVQAINIGDATLTVQKVIPMKKGHSYDLDLIYAQYYSNGGSGYIDFNGEKIIATTDPSDHEYKKTVIPTADMSYKITISFISKYGGNPYFKLAYKKNGGITDKQTTVNVHDSSLYVGDTWKPQDNFDSVIDKTGHSIDISQVTVDSSKVDTTKAGTYNVTYTYDGVTSIAKVTVKDKKIAVNVHDSSLYVGDTWKPQDNFDSVIDKTGHSIDISQVTVDSSKVDTTKAGTYNVTYTYDGVTSIAKVTVKDKKIAVNVHDSSLYAGDTWKPQDNFDSVIDKTGHSIDISQVTVDSSKVDTTKAGTYNVTYTYDGVTSIAKVTVKDKIIPEKPVNTGKNNDIPITSSKNKVYGKQTTHKNSENTKSSTHKKYLPQTGDFKEGFLTFIGIVILVSIGLSTLIKRRRIRK
ncbi:bacterial Ig-like domain-containing protein [Lactococcus lactis]|uniref:bacterial Ig-like domain-containing protein n=1 Tax=Lactococcus lactis TaxID=1358 RepID=UPI00265B16FC|nr:bacterial Ig-like domain-containing protein [Lactococcus lactis]WKF72352.1 bacterial Ig-like domain-containing protein [Lactococcus lactis]